MASYYDSYMRAGWAGSHLEITPAELNKKVAAASAAIQADDFAFDEKARLHVAETIFGINSLLPKITKGSEKKLPAAVRALLARFKGLTIAKLLNGEFVIPRDEIQALADAIGDMLSGVAPRSTLLEVDRVIKADDISNAYTALLEDHPELGKGVLFSGSVPPLARATSGHANTGPILLVLIIVCSLMMVAMFTRWYADAAIAAGLSANVAMGILLVPIVLLAGWGYKSGTLKLG